MKCVESVSSNVFAFAVCQTQCKQVSCALFLKNKDWPQRCSPSSVIIYSRHKKGLGKAAEILFCIFTHPKITEYSKSGSAWDATLHCAWNDATEHACMYGVWQTRVTPIFLMVYFVPHHCKIINSIRNFCCKSSSIFLMTRYWAKCPHTN